jgi:tetratricopeptide (TPR) repeat protein
LLCVVVSACAEPQEETTALNPKDIPLEPYQNELLNIAFEAVSAMPKNPHIKSRSLAQESVVRTCLDLEQPQKALGYIEQIDNWRREACYADLAFYYAQHGASNENVQYYLELAAKVPDQTEDWRKGRITSKISQTKAYMEQAKEAKQYERGNEKKEPVKIPDIKKMTSPLDSFDEKMEALGKKVLTGQFDDIKNSLETYAELYNRFYQDVERRALIEEKIKTTWSKMPLIIRIDLQKKLIHFALAHSDKNAALELTNEAKSMMDSTSWPSRYEIPMQAELAGFRFRAGDEQRARPEVRKALDLFDTERKKIVNIYRAKMLRSIAQAYWTMGNSATTLDLYKRAIEAGIENPNSRPRAEDLASTCCSMALHKVEPDAELLNRIRQIRDDLGDPW